MEDRQVKALWEKMRTRDTAPTTTLCGVSLRYLFIEGEHFYSVNDVLKLCEPLAPTVQSLRHKLYSVLGRFHEEGEGCVVAMPAGLYGDVPYLTFFVKHLNILDEKIAKGEKLSETDSVDFFLDALYKGLLLAGPASVSVLEGFRYADFTRVRPETLRAGNWPNSGMAVNVPWVEEEVEQGLVKPVLEEPLPEEVQTRNHPVDKPTVIEESSYAAEEPENKGQVISVHGPAPVVDLDFKDAIEKTHQAVETDVESTGGLVSALLRGKKININVTVAVE